jgi:hypothetical protein
MDRIVGESFWSGYDGEQLAKWQANKKQTNKQRCFKSLVT